MNEIAQQSQDLYEILGVNVYTHICPNLESFNRFLVTGKGAKSIGNPLLFIGPEFEENPQEIFEQIIQNTKQLLLESQFDVSSSKTNSFSILINNPFENSGYNPFKSPQDEKLFTLLKENFGLALKHTSAISGNFGNAMLEALSLIDHSSQEFVILISIFQYKSFDFKKKAIVGFGSLLLSHNTKENSALVRLSNVDQSDLLNDDEEVRPLVPDKSNNEIKHFIHAPIIQMIGAILELHHKSYFLLLHNKLLIEKIANDEFEGKFIRPWFPPPFKENRKQILSIGDSCQFYLEEYFERRELSYDSFNNFEYYLLPLTIDRVNRAVDIIDQMIANLTASENFVEIIKKAINSIKDQESRSFTLTIMGESLPDLIKELDRARTGVLKSFESGRDWQTPNGSYFTPNPLGPDAKTAFVYPGAFSTYIGMGSEIFYLFPDLYNKLESITVDPAASINANVIFPNNFSQGESAILQEHLNDNPIKMITSGVCFSFLFTTLLRDIFDVNPGCAFGYSLGENSMVFAMGIWKQADAMRTSLEVSPIFHSRVSGEQNAIRQYWNMPNKESNTGTSQIWANYVLMAPVEKVEKALAEEDQVYITHINTSRQVVIGGENEACRRIVDSLNCMHLQASYHHAIHCAPVESEYEGFFRLHNWPVENHQTIPIYSAANYAQLEYDSRSIAHAFAKMLTNPIDFPRLVDLAYGDGSRIFIELGAGSNCTKWVDAVLKGKPHLAVSINNNNSSDYISILRLLSRLISHHVPCNPGPFGGSSNG